MLQPLKANTNRRRVSTGASIPAPVEGWDAVSPLAAMDPKRAVILDNWFPRDGYCEIRRGWAFYSTTNDTDAVETLAAYHGAAVANDALFAISGGTIYDTTNTGAMVATSVTGLTNSRAQSVNFTTSGGHFLYLVNGADDPNIWDGSTWTNPTITGITASEAIHINIHKNRIWFTLRNSTKAAYLPVDSIQGAATTFELGGLFSLGGYLMAMATWTLDAGVGVDDHAVFISSRGEAAVYKGTNPAVAADWVLVGVFRLGAPIGRRCFTNVGGDVAIVSVDGVVPLSKALIYDRAAINNVALTANIAPVMNDSARLYGSNFGWQLIGYPRGTMALLNVPVQEGVTQQQYVMNTISGAWARFTAQNANCWEVFQDRLFFGDNDGNVCEADVAASDGGADIVADLKTAFNYFRSPGVLKRFPMIQPLITSDGRVAPAIDVNTDFRDTTPTSIPNSANAGGILWNEFNWDEANWPEARTTSTDWQTVTAIGQCAAVRMRVIISSSSDSNVWDLGVWDTAVWDSGSSSPPLLQVNGFNLVMERGDFL
jgi:hypothetical protein